MAVRTIHPAFQNRMMVRQLELRANLEMACETGLRRFAGIDNRMGCPAALGVNTAGAMTRLATHVLGVRSRRFQTGVRGGAEIAHDLFVAFATFFCADKFRTRNAGRRHDRAGGRAAGKQDDSQHIATRA